MTTLLEMADRHATAHADAHGVAATPVAGLTIVRATTPTGLVHAVQRPLACLVLQGRKRVTMGTRDFLFGAGDSLLVTADVPTVSQVVEASAGRPYVSFVIELDVGLISGMVEEMGAPSIGSQPPIRVDLTDGDVADAALRLVKLIERPSALPVLGAQLVRELHYWLLAGRHGAAVRRLGWPDCHARRVARAVEILRAEFATTVPVGRLAAVAAMSPSSFHAHFRAATSLSPNQFQKRLRLIEARRLMAEGASAGSAAFAVGYESVPQFTREYGRLFGRPPARDVTEARRAAMAAA